MSISERHDFVRLESGESVVDSLEERVLRVLEGSDFALEMLCVRDGGNEASIRP